MKRFQRFLVILLTMTLAFSAAAIDASAEEIYEVNMVMMTYGTTPTDIEKVEAAINAITEPAIGARVNFVPIGVGQMDTQMNLILSGSEKMDLIPVLSRNFANNVSRGQIIDMTDTLATYGQGITAALGAEFLKAGQINGKQYGVTTCRDLAKNFVVCMRADIAEKYGFTADSVASLAELEPLLEQIKANEPDITPFAPATEKNPFYNVYGQIDPLGNYMGVLMNNGAELKVENLFESEDYRQFCELMHSWYQKGYVQEDAPIATTCGAMLTKAGHTFS